MSERNLRQELDELDAKYAKSPSQKLLDERLKLIMEMMRRR
jgi:hypothetical protein